MKTNWLGLWEQRHHDVFSSQVIRKGEIPKYTRIVMIKNSGYKKDTKRPKYVFCFVDSEGYESMCVPIEPEEAEAHESLDLVGKVEELAGIMRSGNTNGDYAMMPSESQAMARSLMNRAIEIVEEITGEKWDFSYITF